jgi:hypothetical protein
LNSISNVVEEDIGAPVEGLLDRPPVFSALYVSLFTKAANLNHRYVSIRHPTFNKSRTLDMVRGLLITEYMIDSKPQSIKELKEISIIAMHPKLPIVVVSEGTEIIFLSIKSMACLSHFTLPGGKAIKHIVFDETSYKFFVIDVTFTVYVYKFSIDLEQIDLIKTISGHKIRHGSFFRSSNAIVWTTVSTYCVVMDLVTSKVSKVELYDSVLSKNKVEYIPELNRTIFINKKRGILTSTDCQEFSHRLTSELPGDHISCYAIAGDLAILGYLTGVLRIVSLKDFSLLYEQNFDDADGRKVKVEDVAVVCGFVIAGLSNGVASIVNKI